jgi:hypothetical protein
MKLIKTIQKLVEDAERDYYLACDRCADEKVIQRLEKNYTESLKLLEKINKIDKSKKDTDL